MTRKIRWGIISTARIGQTRVIPAIQAARNSEVTAIASRSLPKAQEAAQALNIPTAYGSYEELLADPNIDALYNPLPNDGHALWSLKAAEAGKPVLCEKPLALDTDEAQQMVDTFAGKGIALAEAFMYRFHPQTLAVKEMVDSGAIGQLKTIKSSFSFVLNRAEDVRLEKALGGGALMDVGCYCVGITRFLAGEEPVRIQAFSTFNEDDVDVHSTGILAFASGVLAHFDCSFRSAFRNEYEVCGTEGRIIVPEAFVIPNDRASKVTLLRADGSSEDFTFEPVNQYTLMAEDFADALLNNRPPKYNPQDSVHAMRVLDALRDSAEANKF